MTICEDLLWQYPTVDLVTSNKIDTMIFPTEWWDEYPHQLPHVVQASWAKALQVSNHSLLILFYYFFDRPLAHYDQCEAGPAY